MNCFSNSTVWFDHAREQTRGWLSTSGLVKCHMISTSSSRQTLDCLTSTLWCRYSIITGTSRMLVMSVNPAPLHQRSPLDRTNSDHGDNYWCQLGAFWSGFVELATTQNHLFGRLHHFLGSVITADLELSAQFVLVSSLHPQPIQDATTPKSYPGPGRQNLGPCAKFQKWALFSWKDRIIIIIICRL